MTSESNREVRRLASAVRSGLVYRGDSGVDPKELDPYLEMTLASFKHALPEAEREDLLNRSARALRDRIRFDSSSEGRKASRMIAKHPGFGKLIDRAGLRKLTRRVRVEGFGRITEHWAEVIWEVRERQNLMLVELIRRAERA